MLRKIIQSVVMLVIVTIGAINITADYQTAKIAAQNKNATPYLLKEYNEKIGVFRYNNETPQRTLDVYVESLPKADRIQLETGIPANSESELQQLIEDFDG